MISACEMGFGGRFKERSGPATHFDARSPMRPRTCIASQMLHSNFLCRGTLAVYKALSARSVGSSLQRRQGRDIVG